MEVVRYPKREWTTAEDALLGTMSDRLVAEQLGIVRKTVVERRQVLNVASFRTPAATQGAKAQKALRMLLAAIDAAPRVPDAIKKAATEARAMVSK